VGSSSQRQCRWSCGCPRSQKQREPVWRALGKDCQAGAAGQWIRQRRDDTSSTRSSRGRRSAARSNPRSDEQARSPVAPAEARRRDFPERYARTNTPLVTLIESNRFSICGKSVHSLGFDASAGAHPGKGTSEWVPFLTRRGSLVDLRSIMVDAREPGKGFVKS
jgi:hypothetical protein